MSRHNLLPIAILLVIFVGSLFISNQIATDYGKISVEKVVIPDGGHMLVGLLWTPLHQSSKIPCVVLAHGISNSKDTMCGLAQEIARAGIAVLAIDLDGHGASGGSLSTGDPSLGVVSTINFAKSLEFVDPSSVGVAGHSLGAGAVRYAASMDPEIRAVVLIGGGVGGMAEQGPQLNATYPRNLLVAVGRHDILFTVESLRKSLLPVFGVDTINSCVTYGDIGSGTARRLVTPSTTHLLEPVTPEIVAETVRWFSLALKGSEFDGGTLSYLSWETLNIVSLIVFIALSINIVQVFFEPWENLELDAFNWRTGLTWGFLGLVLFLPLMTVGLMIPFPPLVFGSSLAWWLMGWGVIGALIVVYLFKLKGLREYVFESFNPRNVINGVLIFVPLYLVVYLVDASTGFGLIMLVEVFRPLSPFSRVLVFPTFIPFYLLYFIFESYSNDRMGYNRLSSLAFSKIGPLFLLLVAQYGGMFLLNYRLVPGFAGFFLEFLWAILPLLAVSSVYTKYLNKVEGVWTAIVLNTLLFSWVSAGLFPFGQLF